MSRSIRPTPRAREPRTPRQRIESALAAVERLHADEPETQRIAVVRASDLRAVLDDCPDTQESA